MGYKYKNHTNKWAIYIYKGTMGLQRRKELNVTTNKYKCKIFITTKKIK